MQLKSLKLIFFSYVIIITLGAMILSLPISQYGNVGFMDALFTSTSATCDTGLIVVSTSEDFTFFGQAVILTLIQVGGIGYMSFVTLFYLFVKNNLSIQEKSIAKESLSFSDMGDVSGYLKKVFLFVFAIEILGAMILAIRFSFDMPIATAIWQGIFHSISAFNNAGFSLFIYSMMDYHSDTTILMTINALIVLGGLGYLVLIELWQRQTKKNFFFSIHTKMMLYGTFWLIVVGMALFLSLEYANPKTFGSFSWYDKILNALFLSVNFRTAGYNSIDLSGLSDSSLFFSTVFMMIGGGAGSTAGGIKVTTFVVLVVAVLYAIRESNKPPHIFKRTIGFDQINKALAIIMSASFVVLLMTVLLVETQGMPLLKTLFEVVSAFATVGVSVGNGGILSFSALFNDFGQLVIVIVMLMGRIGIFVFGALLIGKNNHKHIEYPKGRVLL